MTTTAALRELAACPFCGGQASCDTQYQNGPADFNVICLDEFCIGGAWPVAWSCPTQEEAIAKWNTRTQLRAAASEGGAVYQYRWFDRYGLHKPSSWDECTKESFEDYLAHPDFSRDHEFRTLYLHPPTHPSEGGAERDGCDDSVVGMQTNIAIVRNVLNGKRYGEDENASREMALELLEWIGQHAIAAEMTPTGTGASEGGEEPFAHLVMTEWNSIAWWTTESAERAQQEADELMRYDSKRKLTVVTVYTHPPEVARDAGRWMPIESAPRDGSWFVIANFTNPLEDGGDFEIARYKPTYWTRYEAVDGGLFQQVKELSMEFDCNNWHRATHWQPLPAPPQAAISGAAGVG